MKNGGWDRIPLWARFLALLVSIPLAAALLRAGFGHEFNKLTALVLTAVALIVFYLILHWRFASRSVPQSVSAPDKRRDMRKFNFVIAVFLAVIFLAGGVIFLAAAISPLADLPNISRWLIRTASVFLGLLFLVLGLGFTMHAAGRRSLTIRLGKSDSHK